MDCRQEWHEIQPFIRGQLNGEQTKEFLEHLDQCPSCREELEIYYTIEVGLEQLDSTDHNFNIVVELNRYISEARRSIEMARLLDIGKYTIETLVFLCVMVMLLLQFRIW